MPSASPTELTPAQRRTLDVLGAASAARPVFPEGIGAELRAQLEAGLRDVVADLAADEVLHVSKHKLAQVHACEAKLLAEEADDRFEVTIPIARGTVAHSTGWKERPRLTSSSTVGRLGRMRSVCQSLISSPRSCVSSCFASLGNS